MDQLIKDEKDEYNNFLIVDEYPINSNGNYMSNGTNDLSPNKKK